MKIGGAALNQTPLDWVGNVRNIRQAIAQAQENQVELLVLPELCITGYGCEDMFLHPWVAERAMQELKLLISETSFIGVTIGLPLLIDHKVYNALAFVHDQTIIGFYVKQHLPKDGIHYEYRWFEPWKPNVISTIILDGQSYPIGHLMLDFKGKKLTFEICEDAWVADRPACQLSESVDIILNTSASHFAFNKVKRRQEIIRSSSAEFGCVYVYANQVGNESGRIIYDGDVIIAQQGQLLATAKRFTFHDFQLHFVEINFDDVTKSETNLFDQITSTSEEFPQAAGLALFDYMRKSKSKGFVLSLSGGADSSTIAILIAEMVRRGVEEIGYPAFSEKLALRAIPQQQVMAQLLTTAYQGTRNSGNETLESAQKLAESIGASFHHWMVDEEVDGYRNKIEHAIGRPLTWEMDDITLQNIQARSRSPIIWMLANLKNALLLATSNRSEGSVGYATMDGDTSGSISPIAGVSKPFIREWLKYAEKELGYSALKYVNNLAPSAELRPEEQTDEADLMPYEVLLQIERQFALERLSPEQIIDQLKGHYPEDQVKNWVEKFFGLWKRNQWKRERLAPSFHFDDYNIDPRSGFRYPILSGR